MVETDGGEAGVALGRGRATVGKKDAGNGEVESLQHDRDVPEADFSAATDKRQLLRLRLRLRLRDCATDRRVDWFC